MTRLKKLKNNLKFYHQHFNFNEPYKIVADGSFCELALKNKLQIKEQIKAYLGNNSTVHVTSCIIQALEDRGPKFHGPLLVAKGLSLYQCDHKKCVSSEECLLSLVKNQNPNFLFLATQELDLSEKIRQRVGIPLLYIMRNTIVLEGPSISSKKIAESSIQTTISEKDMAIIETIKKERGLCNQDTFKKKIRKKAKGPNPLSCPKKKTKRARETTTPASGEEQPSKKRRKRNRSKAAKKGDSNQTIELAD